MLKLTPVFLLAFISQALASSLKDTCQHAAETYAEIVHASYSDSLEGARLLTKSVSSLVQTPTTENLTKAKETWITCRQPYLQTEVYRFYGGPIDDEDGPEAMINGWPMDEFYIDYVEDAPKAGIINDPQTYPNITPELLADLNEKAGETAISCGYHAIEFLLWGQDFSDDGPGNRPVTDFTTAPNADRRKTYLLACCELLERHLAELVADWAPGNPQNYRAEFLAKDPRRAVWLMLSGMKTMAGLELSGERMLVAWDTQAQEDEHSCFSDTTHQDMIFDAIGLENVFEGRYVRTNGEVIEGAGLKTVAAELDPGTTQKLSKLVADSVAAMKEIPRPFDQAILGEDDSPGRTAIFRSVELLEEQAGLLGKLERLLLEEIRENSQ